MAAIRPFWEKSTTTINRFSHSSTRNPRRFRDNRLQTSRVILSTDRPTVAITLLRHWHFGRDKTVAVQVSSLHRSLTVKMDVLYTLTLDQLFLCPTPASHPLTDHLMPLCVSNRAVWLLFWQSRTVFLTTLFPLLLPSFSWLLKTFRPSFPDVLLWFRVVTLYK